MNEIYSYKPRYKEQAYINVQVGGFLRVLRFPAPINLAATI